MKIKLTSVFVDDQEKAVKFYTQVLGFVKKLDFPMGKFNWLTVVSPEEPEGTQLFLEPNDPAFNPAAKTYQEVILKQGRCAASFFVDDVQKEYERLKKLGVKFTTEPTKVTGSTIAVFDDTCGNLIQTTQLDWVM
jgi:predicted enzyme related to lactoylglutathione lyase